MNRTVTIFLLLAVFIRAFALADPPAPTVQPRDIPDPRSSMLPVILFHHQKEQRAVLEAPLLVFARWDIDPPNQILGVEGSFTNEQIISGLRKFYREWRPPENDSTRPRPQLILARQNWGCGGGLQGALEAISTEFEIDVYQLYPVINHIASSPSHPSPSDKRLAELVKAP